MQSTSRTLRVRDLLFISLLIPLTTAALQKQPVHPINRHTGQVSNAAAAAASNWQPADSLDNQYSGQRGYRDTDVNAINKHKKHNDNNVQTNTARNSRSSERALATVSPAEPNSAVRDRPATRSPVVSSTAGISRLTARSLQDWQVEDLMLLATVDGKLHARDRRSGASRWTLEADREMVQMTRHARKNKTDDEYGQEIEDPLFIVEPSQDGRIYILAPGLGLQQLGYTVKQLFDLAPYREEGFPALQYTAEKKTTLYTVEAATGVIRDMSSASGSTINEADSCRLLTGLEMEEEECKTSGLLTLGRTEYTIGISDSNTKEQILNLNYFEWEPNKRDQDLQRQHKESKDNQYIYTSFDGTFYGMDIPRARPGQRQLSIPKPTFRYKFTSPVVRVFDIVRRPDDDAKDAHLALLSQPVGPSNNEFDDLEVDVQENVFINRTESGNWYALSETNYPSVTHGAATAKCFSEDCLFAPASRRQGLPLESDMLTGVYHLSSHGHHSNMPGLLDEPEQRMTIEPPPVEELPDTGDVGIRLPPSLDQEVTISLRTVITIVMSFAILLASFGLFRSKIFKNFVKQNMPLATTTSSSAILNTPHAAAPVEDAASEAPMIREAEPAMETILVPQSDVPEEIQQIVDAVQDDAQAQNADADAAEADDEIKEPGEVKKKKATRGKRGGRKQKEKEAVQAENRAKKDVNGAQGLQAAEVITVAASESPQISGPVQINSLVIHTDQVLGQGSCGTIVYKGKFEGRDVAVKRMLSTYYELASQEVSFLQQSDDHPNVVRYFCQQKDDHFLYIAVELCQASLFEVWEADRAKDEERQRQMQSLKLTIQQDMVRTLQQLAAGLCHLHNLRIIHRDIKPQNILVGIPKPTKPGTRLVISDFGLGKNLPENVSTLVDPTGNAGTSGWKAPELISQPRENDGRNSHMSTGTSDNGTGGGVSGVKRAADIFSLGCLFFWVLTDGVHPFEDESGWQQMREFNIKHNKKNMSALSRWSDAYEPMQLISSMLEPLPEHRPTAQAVLNHPYFWSPEKRLAFLCDCSDHFEREPRGYYEDNYAGDSYHLQQLEARAITVIGERGDFLSKLDKTFVDTLGKQRKYSGNRLLDLLRALRNKKNHYEDMPEDVKRRVGPLAGGYLAYWGQRFPRLLMECYQVVVEEQLDGTDRFKGYFGLGSV